MPVNVVYGCLRKFLPVWNTASYRKQMNEHALCNTTNAFFILFYFIIIKITKIISDKTMELYNEAAYD